MRTLGYGHAVDQGCMLDNMEGGYKNNFTDIVSVIYYLIKVMSDLSTKQVWVRKIAVDNPYG